MEVLTAINGRRSVRSFTPEPVGRDVLVSMMSAALKAPSWGNTQPWEYAVIGGEAMSRLRASIAEKLQAGEKPNMDVPPPQFKGPHLERAKATARRLFEEADIMTEGSQALTDWQRSMTRFFNAPNAVVVYMDASLNEWSMLDIGLSLENLMLTAWNYGVGSCALSAAVLYPDVLRRVLGIPESKRIIVGVALGHPDFSSNAATLRSEREPMEALVTWHGFD